MTLDNMCNLFVLLPGFSGARAVNELLVSLKSTKIYLI
jgi:hypothetical protein